MKLKRWKSALLVSALCTGTLVLATPGVASAQTVVTTFPGVECTAIVNGSPLTQTQDVTIGITAPDTVAPGETFTVTLPGGSAGLPTRSNGLAVSAYANLFQVIQVNNSTFNAGTAGTSAPNAQVTPAPNFAPIWSAVVSYQIGAIVARSSGTPALVHYYKAIASGLNHPPNTSPTFWTEITVAETAPWNQFSNYTPVGTLTVVGTQFYQSLVTPNTNHPPATSPTFWTPISTPVPTPQSATIINGGNQLQFGTPGPFAAGNPGDGFTATLATPDTSVQVTAPASGDVTINMVSLTTQAQLNGGAITADVTCNIPNSTLITIPVQGPTNTPPTVSAGGDVSGDVNTAIALDGTVTDPDDTPTTAWTSSDPGCTFADATAVDTTVTCTSAGTFTATLTANDGTNPPVSDSAQVTVNDVTPPGGPTLIGACSGAVGLATFADATNLPTSLGDQTTLGLQIKTKLLKNATSKLTMGGVCQAPNRPGAPEGQPPLVDLGGGPAPTLHPKAFAGKLVGNVSCAQGPAAQAVDATAAAQWPASGKVTWTMTELNALAKPWVIQADVAMVGFNPDFADVVNLSGIVLKGAGVGARVMGDLWQDPVTKEAKGEVDPSDIYDSGYKLDAAPALGCANGTAGDAAITQTEFGTGGASATSLLGSTTNGIAFFLGQ